MESVSVAEAKAQLSAVVSRVESGETICITRRGTPVAQIVPIVPPRKPIDVDAIRRHLAKMPYQEQGAAELIRHMRDEVDGY